MAINFNGQIISGVALVGGALYIDPNAEEGMVPLSPPTIITGKDSGVTLEGELQFGFYVYDNVNFYDIKPISAPVREEGGYTISIKSTPETVIHRSKGEYRYTGPDGQEIINLIALKDNQEHDESFIMDSTGEKVFKNVPGRDELYVYWTELPVSAIMSGASLQVTCVPELVLDGHFIYNLQYVGAASATCSSCQGTGSSSTTTETQCNQCGGSGEWTEEIDGVAQVVPCPTCGGDGKITSNSCSTCGGDGSVSVTGGTYLATLACSPGLKNVALSSYSQSSVPAEITEEFLNTLINQQLTLPIEGSLLASGQGTQQTIRLNNTGYVIAWGFSDEPTDSISLALTFKDSSGGTEDPGEQPCLTGDTLITMANGSYKRLDSLTIGEQVRTEDGISTIYAISNSAIYPNHVIYEFEDGTIIKEVEAHAFYNVESNFYKTLNKWDIGEHAINEQGDHIALIRKELVEEETTKYTIWTHQGSWYANGLLCSDMVHNTTLVSDLDIDSVMDILLSIDSKLVIEGLRV